MSDDAAARNEELIRAYRILFSSPTGQVVMADMMRFCCFRKEAYGEIDEGKRRAFLRIVNMSNLTDQQLYALYSGRQVEGLNDD